MVWNEMKKKDFIFYKTSVFKNVKNIEEFIKNNLIVCKQ